MGLLWQVSLQDRRRYFVPEDITFYTINWLILAHQDIFLPMAPVNRKQSENLNFMFIKT